MDKRQPLGKTIQPEPYNGRRAYRYRLDPTPAQAARLDHWLGMARGLYNALVNQRLMHLSDPLPARRYLRLFGPDGQQAMVAASSGQLPAEYAELPANVKQEISRRVDMTFQRWYKRQGGRPRFQSYRRYDSIIYESPTNWSIGWDGERRHGLLTLRRPGIDRHSGWNWPLFQVPVRIDNRRGLPKGEMRTLAVSRRAGHWYASISCRDVPAREIGDATGEIVGVDLRISRSFITLSTGERIEQPRYYREALRHLAMCQRRVSRRKRGSRRREEAVRLLQKAHSQVANARLDFHHKLALDLARRFSVIVVEDISPLFMVEKRQREHSGLAIGALDAGWSQFLTLLRQKCAEYGREYVEVEAAYTSQTCSTCGAVHDPEDDDQFACPDCGLILDTDVNAARVIASQWYTGDAEAA